ncbi:nucleolysin TIAR-like [Artemia franciscana]|uniref:nucleolysin TIAR-like n=1 Tax=Artemia franciscana TaxID=6661 RepID=UPI0032DBBE6C
MHNLSGSEDTPRTLYVGNLDPSVTEELILVLFGQIGPVKGCKIIQEPGNDPYCFVEFGDHQSASAALAAMNKRNCLGKEMKVNWATSPGNAPKTDTSKHHHIFVGDLSPEIETQTLRDAFAPFGEISDCRVVRDPQTMKSKGYGFVSFVKKTDAENAIASMNGQWLGSRAIRTNWATRKPPAPKAEGNSKPLSFDEVYNQSSPTNCTVYCGGFGPSVGEETIQKTFTPYGQIQEIRVFKDKGYAFIRFATKESATHAIVAVHNTEMGGSVVKCSWGKETSEPSATTTGQPALPTSTVSSTATTTGQYPYGYGQQNMGYWYPGATGAAYPQMQSQFLQGMQGYAAYGQFGYQPSMPIAGGWQGVSPQGQQSGQQIANQGQGAQPGNVMAYSLQQFQAQ